ncbi:unnamed protein product [Pipistrellus nathusii]|uniref:Uncharacterized protein n=1 Tax=Pipistrellus nathusii TaxID=59473 RepID=A0ABN9ZRK7_PIPNA
MEGRPAPGRRGRGGRPSDGAGQPGSGRGGGRGAAAGGGLPSRDLPRGLPLPLLARSALQGRAPGTMSVLFP